MYKKKNKTFLYLLHKGVPLISFDLLCYKIYKILNVTCRPHYFEIR